MKKLIVASLALSLMGGAVMAQTSPQPSSPSTPPSATTAPSTMSTPSTPPAPSAASVSAQTMSTPPAQSTTVTNWYKQTVYDPANATVGQVMDVLLQPDGSVAALIVGVGGFLGMGEHSVAVPFSAVKHTMRDGKTYLTMDMTKEALKSAPGLRYDNATTTWVPDTK